MDVDLGTVKTMLQTQGMKLLGGLAALVVGLILVHWIMKLLTGKEGLRRVDPTLRGFLENLVRILLNVIVILTAANIMGIPLTTFVTLFASASVAITLAMQGALSNFVGGVTVLLLRLLKTGDYVKIGDVEGTVRKIGIFYTDLVTPDNRHIFLPNSALTGTAIVNYTKEGTRRLDVVFSVGYPSDIGEVRTVLSGVVQRTAGILSEPAPLVRLDACADSSLNFVVRVWCGSSDYWNVKWDLTENGKRALDAAGIEIPYPQMDVHLK